MTTIAHISDTHLGNRQYGSDVRRQDFIDSFEVAVEVAIDANVDAIIHTGDLFHRRTPPLPEVNACIRILQQAADADIPFYAIVGNHDRKMDDQWLDLIEHTGTAARLDQSPTIVGGDNGDAHEADDNGDSDNDDEDEPAVALYGIDAVPAPAWDATSFALDSPPDEHADAYRLLCMHQLLSPPVPEIMADYPTEAVIDRLDLDIDGLALGDYHEAESATVAGVDVWYAGSTERGGAGEAAPRLITFLESTDDGGFRRTHHQLDTRPFRTIDIEFGEDDGRAHARETIQNHDLSEAVAVATLTGKRTSLTAGGVHDLLLEQGAAVGRVDDSRGREHLDLDLDDAPSAAVEDPDTLIGERLAEADFSDATLAVESEVRGEGTATNSLDSTAEEIITEAQEAAFSEGGPGPAVVLTDDGDHGQADADSDGEIEASMDVEEQDVTPTDDETTPDADQSDPTSADGGTDSDDAPEADGEAPDKADSELASPMDEAAAGNDEDSPDDDTDADEGTGSGGMDDRNDDMDAKSDSMDDRTDGMDAGSSGMDAKSDSMDGNNSTDTDTNSDTASQASFADLAADTDDSDNTDGDTQ